MKVLVLSARDRRVLALGLAAGALVLAYFALLHWWFVAPLLRIHAEMDALRTTHARYEAVLAEAPAIRARLAALDARQSAGNAFWGGGDRNSATTALMQRIVDVVAANAVGGSCTIRQKLLEPDPRPIPGDPYRRAAVNVQLDCDMQPLVAVLHALEDGSPYAFVEDLSIHRNPAPANPQEMPPLDVRLTLSGYLRPVHADEAGLNAQRRGATP